MCAIDTRSRKRAFGSPSRAIAAANPVIRLTKTIGPRSDSPGMLPNPAPRWCSVFPLVVRYPDDLAVRDTLSVDVAIRLWVEDWNQR